MLTIAALGGAALVVDGGPRAFHAERLEGGAFDERALAWANRAVGNAWHAPALEVTMGPLALRASDDVRVAVAGSDDDDVRVLRAGETLRVKRAKQLRFVVAVARGLADEPGTSVAVNERVHVQHGGVVAAAAEEVLVDDDGPLRVVAGAEAGEFSFSVSAFCARSYSVDPSSSRMGIRLRGALPVTSSTDVLTRGAWFGDVQVTSSGQPVILGPDQRRTGGYARIAHVISVDRWRLAQKKPGDPVSFTLVDVEEARRLRRERQVAWTSTQTSQTSR